MQNRRIYSFDNFQIDAGNRQLRRGDHTLALSARAFDLLVALVENNGRLVAKDELFASVWHGQIVEESNLTVHVSQIRKALGEDKNNPRYIETVAGYGYRFNGSVSNWDDEETIIETQTLSRITVEKEASSETEISDGEKWGWRDRERRSVVPAAATPPHRRLSALQAVAAAVALIAVAGGIFWLSYQYRNTGAIAPVVLAEKQINIKRLTSKGFVDYGLLSPDGKFFAYSLHERGAYRSSLWFGQTSGNADVRLLPAADLAYNPRAFSADGNWLYYTASEPRGFDNGTLYKMPVLGGVPQELLSDINVYAVLSPDEKQVAYIRRGPENKAGTLVTAALDGSATREIAVRTAAEGPFLAFDLSWSADGRMVAFAAETGKNRNHEVFTVNAASGEIRQITTHEWVAISRIGWLGDGSGILAVARDKNSFAANQIWQIDLESGKAQKITSDLQHYGSTLSLSADANALIAIQSVRESNIWVAPAADLAAARQITFGSSGHEGWFGIDWAPDGTIIYTARIDQSVTIWSMDADGANSRQITSAGFLDANPSVTPDGRYIIFESNRSGATEIWRVNRDGTDPRQLTFDGKNSFPHSMPDGRILVYTHNADGTNTAWRVSIEGGEAIQISGAECYNARVSPDGNFIACGSIESGKTTLAVVPVAGGEAVKAFAVPPTFNFTGSIRWTRDGNFITYRDWANGIWRQSAKGGEPERLKGLPPEKLYQYNWSSDGKQFVFTRGRDIRDAVLITDFR